MREMDYDYDDYDQLEEPTPTAEPSALEAMAPVKEPRLKKPRRTLNVDLLKDQNHGLPLLQREFRKARFRGKGYELDDLSRLLRIYQDWAHQLFPKLEFTAFLERIQNIGRTGLVNDNDLTDQITDGL